MTDAYKDTADSLRRLADWAADDLYEESMYVRSTCKTGAEVIEALLRELAAYKEAEERGRMAVIPPCKLGDTFYRAIKKTCDRPDRIRDIFLTYKEAEAVLEGKDKTNENT